VDTLPRGIVTFLIADVEGSTRLQENRGLDYPAVISSVRRILRDQIEDKGGLQVDAVGDEVLAVFVEAAPAVEAALGAQRGFRDHEWPAEGETRVRIGIHTGSPSYGEEGYTGIDVVRAARIAQSGHGGQIVISSATRDAVADLSTRDLGEHRMEGLQEPERVYQVLADDLPRDFPALRNTRATLGDSVRVVLADDTVLLREGQPGDRFFVLLSGVAGVSQSALGGRGILRAGEYFGEVALAMNVPRTATVTAMTPCVVASCDAATFDELLRPLFADD